MNTIEMRAMRIESLKEYCNEFGCDKREGLIDVLLICYTGVTWEELLVEEFSKMSDTELMELYINS